MFLFPNPSGEDSVWTQQRKIITLILNYFTHCSRGSDNIQTITFITSWSNNNKKQQRMSVKPNTHRQKTLRKIQTTCISWCGLTPNAGDVYLVLKYWFHFADLQDVVINLFSEVAATITHANSLVHSLVHPSNGASVSRHASHIIICILNVIKW